MTGKDSNFGEPISETEKHDLEHRIQVFIKDPDPEVDINLDGDMRKINYVLRRLKKMVNLGPGNGTGPNQVVVNGSSDSDQERVKQFQITPDELIRLKEILEQRDTEIAVLTQLLKKERRKPRQSYNAQKYTEDSHSSVPSTGSVTPVAQLSRVNENMSEARKIAFERFRNEVYVENGSYRQQKAELSELIHLAKSKGSEVQAHRAEINKIKGEFAHVSQQMAVLDATGHDSSHELKKREEELRARIDVEKRKYQAKVAELKKIKPQVDHLQHTLEKQRIEMHRQFDEWFKNEADCARNGVPPSPVSRPGSSISGASVSRREISLTGDATADNDIREFLAARQRVQQQRLQKLENQT